MAGLGLGLRLGLGMGLGLGLGLGLGVLHLIYSGLNTANITIARKHLSQLTWSNIRLITIL